MTAARNFLAQGVTRVDAEALVEAGDVYGDDVDRELADIEAGRHPLQHEVAARRAALLALPLSDEPPTPEEDAIFEEIQRFAIPSNR